MITREVARLFASAGEYDVAVMGAGPGGIGAAVAAALQAARAHCAAFHSILGKEACVIKASKFPVA